MKVLKIINVVGARPNFMKMAPILQEMQKHRNIRPLLLHTGQHYDKEMSKLFFQDLQLPKPDIFLGVGSGSHAEQTAKIMTAFEKILSEKKPDLVLVVGDVNSTLACSLVSAKAGVPVAHVEAGLRSYDRSMPEEINRIVTDSLSDYLFTTCKDAEKNLHKEGVSRNKIFFTGNTMIDTLLTLKPKAEKLKTHQIYPKPYMLLTLHRPSNVDDQKQMRNILDILQNIQKETAVIFPVHPRTRKNLEKMKLDGIIKKMKNLYLIPPVGYLEFLNLMVHARAVLTDSGGIQEETTVLHVPCLTMRNNTERPVTIEKGTNVLVGNDKQVILEQVRLITDNKFKKGRIPELWDGKAAARIVKVILEKLL